MLEVWLCSSWSGWPYENSSGTSSWPTALSRDTGSFPSFSCHGRHTRRILLWLPYASVFFSICEFLEGKSLIFLSDSELHKREDHGHPRAPLKPRSPARPWHTAHVQGRGPAAPSAQHGLCPSDLHSNAFSARLSLPPHVQLPPPNYVPPLHQIILVTPL